jgi:hypothetical protein
MGTLADKFLYLKETKDAIKASIESKGRTVGGIPFREYASKIDEISGEHTLSGEFNVPVIYKDNISEYDVLLLKQENFIDDINFDYVYGHRSSMSGTQVVGYLSTALDYALQGGSASIRLYKKENNQYTYKSAPPTLGGLQGVPQVFLDPSGTYVVALVNNISPYYNGYKINKTNDTIASDTSWIDYTYSYGDFPYFADFSRDGAFLCIAIQYARTDTAYLYIYKWDSATSRYVRNIAPYDTQLPAATRMVSLSSDGSYMAVCLLTSPYLILYKWNPATNKYNLLPSPSVMPTSSAYSIKFSPNDEYLAVSNNGSSKLIIYKRDVDTFTTLSTIDIQPTIFYNDIYWSNNSRELILSRSSYALSVYDRVGDTFTKTNKLSGVAVGSYSTQTNNDEQLLFGLSSGGFDVYDAKPPLRAYLSDNIIPENTVDLRHLGFARADGVSGDVNTVTAIWSLPDNLYNADFSVYYTVLNAISSQDITKYTTSSWNSYQDIVLSNVMNKTNSQIEVNTATYNIFLAQKDLVRDPEEKNITPYLITNQEVFPSTDKLLSKVTLLKDTVNHIPANIKKDVSLYGVTGTFDGETASKEFEVRFFDIDASLLKVSSVDRGENAELPTTPTHAPLVFSEWSYDTTNVQQHLDVGAVYAYPNNEVYLEYTRLTRDITMPFYLTRTGSGTVTVEFSEGAPFTSTSTGNITISCALPKATRPSLFSGTFWVKIYMSAGSGTFTLANSNNNMLNYSSSSRSNTYTYDLKKMYIGAGSCTGFGHKDVTYGMNLTEFCIPSGFTWPTSTWMYGNYKTLILPRRSGASPTETMGAQCRKVEVVTISQGYTSLLPVSASGALFTNDRIIIPEGIVTIQSALPQLYCRGIKKVIISSSTTGISSINNVFSCIDTEEIIFNRAPGDPFSVTGCQNIFGYTIGLKSIKNIPTFISYSSSAFSGAGTSWYIYWSPEKWDNLEETFVVPSYITSATTTSLFQYNRFKKLEINHMMTALSFPNAFYLCRYLSGVVDLSNVLDVRFGSATFTSSVENYGITKFIIRPDSLTQLGSGCFSYMRNLEEIDMSAQTTYTGNLNISNMFEGCRELRKITFPPNATGAIGSLNITSTYLKRITIPAGITSISGTIGNIGDGALGELVVTKPDGVVTLGGTSYISSLVTSGLSWIYVPDDLVATYTTATNWSTFAAMLKPMSELPIES